MKDYIKEFRDKMEDYSMCDGEIITEALETITKLQTQLAWYADAVVASTWQLDTVEWIVYEEIKRDPTEEELTEICTRMHDMEDFPTTEDVISITREVCK